MLGDRAILMESVEKRVAAIGKDDELRAIFHLARHDGGALALARAKRAVRDQILLDRVEAAPGPRVERLPMPLRVRGSVGPPRAG